MKKINKTLLIYFLSIIFLMPFMAFSQRCDKKDLCTDEDYGDYDYRSQTHFAKLSPGDTATINIVAYSGNDMRILVCADEELGDVIYQIVESVKELKKEKVTQKEHLKDPVFLSEPDPMTGSYVKMTENGDTLFNERDTTYIVEKKYFITKDDIKFDSKSNKSGKPYYEEKGIKKTKRLKIKVQVPPGGDEEFVGCVNVLVGRKSAKSNKFYRGQD